MNALLATAFLLGIAGSAHCVGMCGPIALAVPSPAPGWRARLTSTLILNSGRLLTYMLSGCSVRSFRKSIGTCRSPANYHDLCWDPYY
ncbi:MAG: sulfite exporter TauE/SafE family protein [Flavobacteriales bacterium]|nr:sulfite exporter TauE/SafE family protein [Flavobacteriales bacterium]